MTSPRKPLEVGSKATLTIVSGSPGAGKTTLCVRLAQETKAGLHIPSDVFYSFPAHALDPTRPEANDQNRAIMHAMGAAAAAFLAAGYEVFLEGIIGPWFLPTVLEEIPADVGVAYVLMTAGSQTSVGRVREREGRDFRERVLSTHSRFVFLGPYEDHRVETTNRSLDEVCDEVRSGLAEGRFLLRRD